MKLEDELDEDGKEGLRRLKNVNGDDIVEMDTMFLWKLAGGFRNPNLVRLIVAKGKDKHSKERIMGALKRAYQFEFRAQPDGEKFTMLDLGYDWTSARYFKDIEYDIATNQPLVSEIEAETDSEYEMLKAENEQLKKQIKDLQDSKLDSITKEELDRIFPMDDTIQTAGDSQLQTRIAEREKEFELVKAENDSLKQQLEECQSQLKANGIQKTGNDDWLVELFSHFCYEDTQVAQSIIDEMRDKTDPEIADIIFERKKQNKISPKTQNRELWRILHAATFYRGIEGNLNTALRRRQQQ